MPYKRRSGRSKFFRAFLKRAGLVLMIVLAVTAFSVIVRTLLTKNVAAKEQPILIAKADRPEPDASSEMEGKYYGLCRRNSIRTVEDFRRTVQEDATLSAHFAGFRWENAKLGKLDEALWSFVS